MPTLKLDANSWKRISLLCLKSSKKVSTQVDSQVKKEAKQIIEIKYGE